MEKAGVCPVKGQLWGRGPERSIKSPVAGGTCSLLHVLHLTWV